MSIIAGSTTASTIVSGSVRNSTPSGGVRSPTRKGVTDLQRGDVELDPLGDVGREALHLDLAEVVLHHAAGVHTDRIADLVELDVHGDLLVAAHRHEVDVDEAVVDQVALDLTGDREVLVAVELQVDQDAGLTHRVENVEQIEGAHVDRRGLDTGSVEGRGNASGRAQTARGPLPFSLRGSAWRLASMAGQRSFSGV